MGGGRVSGPTSGRECDLLWRAEQSVQRGRQHGALPVTAAGNMAHRCLLRREDAGQAEGIPAEVCAARILKGIFRDEEEVFIGGGEMKAVWIKRFFPRLFSRLIRKQKPE